MGTRCLLLLALVAIISGCRTPEERRITGVEGSGNVWERANAEAKPSARGFPVGTPDGISPAMPSPPNQEPKDYFRNRR